MGKEKDNDMSDKTEHKEFKTAAHLAFIKSLADKKDWIESLELEGIDKDLFEVKVKDIFVSGMKYGVKIVKDKIT